MMCKRVFQITLLLFTTYLIVGICLGDTIVLDKIDRKTKQNLRIEGKILKEDKDTVTIETYPGETRIIPKKEIKQIIKGKPPWEIYEEKKKNIKDTAKDHYELGKWCDEHCLKKEAVKEWEKAVELDPDFEKARKSLGQIKDNKGNWRPEKEVMKEKGMVQFEGKWISKDKFPKEMEKGGYTLTFRIAIEDDVDDAFMKDFEKRIKEVSATLWRMTRGQFYIGEVSVTDKTSEGNVIIEKGFARTNDYSRARCLGIGYNQTMWVPGQFVEYTFLHESGHARLGLPDERKCSACLMCGYSEESVRDMKYCDETNHTVEGLSCWERLKEHWPNLVGPDNDPFCDVPETKVKIVNK